MNADTGFLIDDLVPDAVPTRSKPRDDTIRVPMRPNFVFVEATRRPIPIAELSDAELEQLGRRWTAALIADAAEKRARLS